MQSAVSVALGRCPQLADWRFPLCLARIPSGTICAWIFVPAIKHRAFIIGLQSSGPHDAVSRCCARHLRSTPIAAAPFTLTEPQAPKRAPPRRPHIHADPHPRAVLARFYPQQPVGRRLAAFGHSRSMRSGRMSTVLNPAQLPESQYFFHKPRRRARRPAMCQAHKVAAPVIRLQRRVKVLLYQSGSYASQKLVAPSRSIHPVLPDPPQCSWRWPTSAIARIT